MTVFPSGLLYKIWYTRTNKKYEKQKILIFSQHKAMDEILTSPRATPLVGYGKLGCIYSITFH
jgi:hypothetical protein